ncbi:MAG TPA: glycosyl hydrolase family 65 protein [Opitutaceae bacterium]|nr:glycosyl hydrolase family 65 protein [Opitutaceae bacterium]
MNKLWEISTHEYAGDKESIMRRGNVYQIANGYMGYRGTLDEFGPEEAVGTILAGIFDRVGSAWREPVNAPNGGFTEIYFNGEALSTLAASVKQHRQTLNFRNAVFERETVFSCGKAIVTIRSSRFLSADNPHLGVIRFSFLSDSDGEVLVRTGIDGNIWDLNGPHLPELTASELGEVIALHGRTHEQRKNVVVAEAIDATFGEASLENKERRLLHVIRLQAKAGITYSFSKYFSVFTDHDRVGVPLVQAAVDAVVAARAAGFESCLARHEAEWENKWSRCDVRIEGDDESQQALRYSILQLLMVAPVKGSANSIPARALSGQVYKGAIFWDTEMFMFPFFLHADPEKAVELLRYRIRTLDGARRKAITEGPGYRGAFYAWESQETGDDACTYFNIGDPITGRELRTHFRDKQVHISGDVAIALWEYFKLTGDDTLLVEGGAEVIFECARFYYSYAHFKKDKGRYEILDVIGPDEYHERINNNAFTNMVAKETFAIAIQTADYLRRTHAESFHALVRKLGIENELQAFEDASRLLYVPQPDPKTGVIEQFDGYFQLRDASVDELKAKMIHPNEYLGAGQGLAVPTKIIKQADVVMMLNLFRSRFTAEVKKANWEYYEPRTEHGSSLSACAYALVATECGHLDFATKYFLKTARIDLEAKYKIYVGTVFMGGSHPAANGGAWMTAVFGFGGLHATETAVHINPRLPARWKSLEFNLAYKGQAFRIRITDEKVTVTAEKTNTLEHEFVIAGTTFKCGPQRSVTMAYRPAAMA